MVRQEVLPALLEVASEQGGYVTTRQAARFGIQPNRLAQLAQSGDVRRVRWGVYAMRHAHHRLEDEISAWLSVDRERLPWERDDEAIVVLSHASAAALHDLGTVIPRLPSLTVPPENRGATRGTEIELHVAPLPRADWSWVRSHDVQLPTTTPSRTIVDLLLSGEELSYVQRAISEAIVDGRVTPEELLDTARRRKSRTAGLTQRLTSLLEAAAA